jgi:hypothetical protein
MQTELLILPESGRAHWRAWVEAWLHARPGWHTSQVICAASGGCLTDRTLRDVISSSDLIISSARGFQHIEHATPEEIRHFLNDLLSRARAMARRYAAVRRRAHAIIG